MIIFMFVGERASDGHCAQDGQPAFLRNWKANEYIWRHKSHAIVFWYIVKKVFMKDNLELKSHYVFGLIRMLQRLDVLVSSHN